MNDPYTIGAAEMLGIPPNEVTEHQRTAFKNALLSALYAAGEQRLLDSIYSDLQQRKESHDAKH